MIKSCKKYLLEIVKKIKYPAIAGLFFAETEGFEPSIRFPVYTLSKRTSSATRANLRRVAKIHFNFQILNNFFVLPVVITATSSFVIFFIPANFSATNVR